MAMTFHSVRKTLSYSVSNGNTDCVATFYLLKVKMCDCAAHEVSLELGRSRGLLCPYTVHFEGSYVRVIVATCNSSKSLAVIVTGAYNSSKIMFVPSENVVRTFLFDSGQCLLLVQLLMSFQRRVKQLAYPFAPGICLIDQVQQVELRGKKIYVTRLKIV